jgi:hypothetical protein
MWIVEQTLDDSIQLGSHLTYKEFFFNKEAAEQWFDELKKEGQVRRLAIYYCLTEKIYER